MGPELDGIFLKHYSEESKKDNAASLKNRKGDKQDYRQLPDSFRARVEENFEQKLHEQDLKHFVKYWEQSKTHDQSIMRNNFFWNRWHRNFHLPGGFDP